jgi:uncharacterized repeat protein (TIGR03803 family)
MRYQCSALCGAAPRTASLFAAIAVSALVAFPQDLTTIYQFTGGSDGAEPWAPVLIGPDGVLYGTTFAGGILNPACSRGTCGVVFSLAPPATAGNGWTQTVLYSFTGGSDGYGPVGGSLVADAAGALYGAASIGGGPNNGGTVFSLSPPASQGGPWTESTLHTFTGTGAPSSDGAEPFGTLVVDAEGVLYGTTDSGGAYGLGTAFSLAPPKAPGEPWTETILHSFGNGSDGLSPFAGLVAGGRGLFYGTTLGGGTFNVGTVYSLQAPTAHGDSWTETVLYSFGQSATDGDGPEYGTLVIGKGGVLYGTTYYGGAYGEGSAFSLSPPAEPGGVWAETVIYSFDFQSGALPMGGLALGKDGILYGATSHGGSAARDSNGTVFQLKPPATQGGAWTYTKFYTFTDRNPNGQAPRAGLTLGTNALYGTTSGQGLDTGATPGTVFRVPL